MGEEIKVSFNLRGREWTRDNEVRYFNTLDAWRIERVGNSSNAGAQQNYSSNNSSIETNVNPVFTGNTGSADDDLPF